MKRTSRRCMTTKNTPKRSEEHTSELQSLRQLVCRLLLEKKKRPAQGKRADVPVFMDAPGLILVAAHGGAACAQRPQHPSATAAPCGNLDSAFFLKDGATPEPSLLPHKAALPI